MNLATVVLVALAAYRVTRIVTLDSLTHEWRAAVYRWAWLDPNDATFAARLDQGARDAWPRNADGFVPVARGPVRTYVFELFTCSYCLGVWSGAALWALWTYAATPGRAFVAVMAIAGGQAVVVGVTDARSS